MAEELPVVAEGEGPRGERWYLTAGGSAERYESMLKTVYPDGRTGGHGMGGPALHSGQPLNVYSGRGDDGPLQVVVRADPRVVRLRLRSEHREQCELLPCAHDPAVGVSFFAVLLPWTSWLAGIEGLDADGRALTDSTPRRPR